MGERVLHSAVRGPTTAVLSDARVALLVFLVWVSAGRSSYFVTVAGVLAALALCLPFILHFTRLGRINVSSAVFWTCDAVADLVVLAVGVQAGSFAFALASAHMLCAAALAGVCASGWVQVLWLALVASACAPAAATKSGPGVVLALVVGCGLLTLLGRHVARQVRSVSDLMAEIARTRSHQAALEERLEIARDLHDTVAKSAAGVRMLAESLHDAMEPASPLASQTRMLFEAAAALSLEARDVLTDLRGEGCDDVRLVLARQARLWGQVDDRALAVTVTGEAVPVGSSTMRQLERVLGEILENVARHARAAHVWVGVNGENGLHLVVEDDGVGLPEPVLAGQCPAGHYGLIGVRERIEGVGGHVDVARRDPCGTRMEISVPSAAVEQFKRLERVKEKVQ